MRFFIFALSIVVASHTFAISAPLGEISQIHPSPAEMFSKWRTMLERQTSASGQQCDIHPAKCLPSDILIKVELASSDNMLIQLQQVNKIVNKVRYRSDKRQYGTTDYWASPLEFFANGKGDCEDYSIAKYFALRALGVASADMRLIIAKDSKINEFHAVLSVKVGNQFYILDNRTSRVKPDITLKNLKPIYALNESHWWLYKGAVQSLKG